MGKIRILLDKGLRKITAVKSNHAALSGSIIEKTNPKFLKNAFAKLPYGVVVVTGTNGKTTTVKAISELLRKQGLKVFTNETGNNFIQGIIAATIEKTSLSGKLDYDIAVLELDETHADKFIKLAPFNYAVILNISRDPLNFAGDTAKNIASLQAIASAAEKSVILNREDIKIAALNGKQPQFFGLSTTLANKSPYENETERSPKSTYYAKVVLDKYKDGVAKYIANDKNYTIQPRLKGAHNAYNIAAAIALCTTVLPKANIDELFRDAQSIEPVIGRGETIKINDVQIELLLVKNPSALKTDLELFASTDYEYMFCINDKKEDGRDPSWLWDVDFSTLKKVSYCTGTRCTDIALRLKYNDIKVEHIEEDTNVALDRFLNSNKKPKCIIATSSEMREIRKELTGKGLL